HTNRYLHSFPTRRSSDLPYLDPKNGYVQQWNFDIQRELPAGFFADVAYAGSHGVHLPQFETHVNQIPDSFVAQAAAQAAAGQPRSEEHTSELQSRGHLVC